MRMWLSALTRRELDFWIKEATTGLLIGSIIVLCLLIALLIDNALNYHLFDWLVDSIWHD